LLNRSTNVPQTLQYRLSRAVSFYLSAVMSAVQLEDEAGGRAVEIRDKPCQHVLAAEVKSVEFVGSEVAPEEFFSP